MKFSGRYSNTFAMPPKILIRRHRIEMELCCKTVRECQRRSERAESARGDQFRRRAGHDLRPDLVLYTSRSGAGEVAGVDLVVMTDGDAGV